MKKFDIAKFRKELKKYQIKQLSEKSGTGKMTICNWKNGRHFIRIDDLLSVLSAIDKNINDFLNGRVFDIENFRKELGNHTTRQVSDGSSVSRTTVCNWRNGIHFMRINSLLNVIDAMGKDINDFLIPVKKN